LTASGFLVSGGTTDLFSKSSGPGETGLGTNGTGGSSRSGATKSIPLISVQLTPAYDSAFHF
jgi:hypothetical protein